MVRFFSWGEDEDESEVVEALFCEFDLDGDGIITASELSEALKNISPEDDGIGLRALQKLFADDPSLRMDIKCFKELLQKIPRIRGQRLRWVKQLRLEAALARHLRVGTLMDGLKGVCSMNEDDLHAALDKFCEEVSSIVLDAWKRLKDGRLRSTCDSDVDIRRTMDKYRDEGRFLGNFGTKFMFDGGLESELGIPDPCILRAILREHVEANDSGQSFFSSNYGLVTTPRHEFARLFGDPKEYNSDESIPRFLLETANGPSETELQQLTDLFTQLREVYCDVGRKNGGIFAGEEGDRVDEIVLSISFPTSALDLSVGTPIITEKVRLALIACLESVETSADVKVRGIMTVVPANVVGREIVMKISLPYKEITHAQLQIFKHHLCHSLKLSSDVNLSAVQRSFEYCKFVDEAALQRSIDEMDLKALREMSARGYQATEKECREAILQSFRTQDLSWRKQCIFRRQGRQRLTLTQLMCKPAVQAAGLRIEEAIVAYQYTGPIFMVKCIFHHND